MEGRSSGEVLELAGRFRSLDRERKRIAASRARFVCYLVLMLVKNLRRVAGGDPLLCRCRQEVEAWAARVGEEVAAARRALLARVEAAHGQGQVRGDIFQPLSPPSDRWGAARS